MGGKNREIVAGRDKNVITIMFTYFFIEFFFHTHALQICFFLVFGKMSTRFSAGRGTGSNPRAGIVVIGSELATGVPLLTPRVLFFS